ncbi:STAS domain-containing protein [Lysinibacillus sp. BW-2-10]|uniref:STAS domain-containing protein n=1 Tax=Lysinibacillus sp. BW-2-10 TaxID=2590030 RepID=UPI00117F35EC|nr:STAS domain-containing protein [Lysinibacillus sp. BW-2-10]TSI02646.1 STAS domain-containing protein [Lysinibacillus sp. BW-2-10]
MRFSQKGKMDVLEVLNEITIKNVETFREHMQQIVEGPSYQFILNVETVIYLNSSALGIIADTAMKAKKLNKEFVLAGVKPPLDEVFEIVRFGDFIKLFPTLTDAIDYFSA